MLIPVSEPLIEESELYFVSDAVKSGWVSSAGTYIHEFERAFASYCSRNFSIATSNGTTALHLALLALGVGEGDEVIVPDLTFIATANAVTYTGATPVFADVTEDYWCIDPDDIKSKITDKTKAIIPVHLYGHPCEMKKIQEIADLHSLFIIEDAAEAHGAKYEGELTGSFGDISCFSFYGNKVITTGEGGICLLNDQVMADKIKILRDHGKSEGNQYWHEVVGYNYRMTNMQAALGVAQMKKIDRLLAKKKEIAEFYNKYLSEISLHKYITLPPKMAWAEPVCWIYTILIEEKFGLHRDEVADELRKRDIETRPIFTPISHMPPYYSSDSFKVSDRLSCKGLSLPSGYRLSEDQIKYISNIINDICFR